MLGDYFNPANPNNLLNPLSPYNPSNYPVKTTDRKPENMKNSDNQAFVTNFHEEKTQTEVKQPPEIPKNYDNQALVKTSILIIGVLLIVVLFKKM